MSDDRELLELAGRAAGQERSAAGDLWSNARGMLWAPRDDDGDAFRLAVRLQLEVRYAYGCVHAGHSGRFWETVRPGDDGDAAAARQAIVQAAAYMTKQAIAAAEFEARK